MRSAASMLCGGNIPRSGALRRVTAAARRSRSAASACRAPLPRLSSAAIRFCSASSRAISPVSARSWARSAGSASASAPRRAAARPAAHRVAGLARRVSGQMQDRCRAAAPVRHGFRPGRGGSRRRRWPSRSISCRIAASARSRSCAAVPRRSLPGAPRQAVSAASRLGGRLPARRPAPPRLPEPALAGSAALAAGQSRQGCAPFGGSRHRRQHRVPSVFAPGASQSAGAAVLSAAATATGNTVPAAPRTTRSIRRKASLGGTPLIRYDQRMPGHPGRLFAGRGCRAGSARHRPAGRCRCEPIAPGGLTTMNGTGFSVCAVCGSPVSRVAHHLGIAVIGGDDQRAARRLDRLGEPARGRHRPSRPP